MTAYLILFVEEIIDQDEMTAYRREVSRADLSASAPLVIYGRKLVMEGPDFVGVAMLAFPSLEEARAWYQSPGYQRALAHRLRGAKSRLVIVEGVDGSTPVDAVQGDWTIM
jgi:uncharacterized protein (DUF1330 family)